MDVKEAAKTAKTYLAELYSDEAIMNVGLEEVEFDDVSGNWKITIGFSRPWDQRGPMVAALVERSSSRSYKVIRINDEDGLVISLTDRLLAPNRD